MAIYLCNSFSTLKTRSWKLSCLLMVIYSVFTTSCNKHKKFPEIAVKHESGYLYNTTNILNGDTVRLGVFVDGGDYELNQFSIEYRSGTFEQTLIQRTYYNDKVFRVDEDFVFKIYNDEGGGAGELLIHAINRLNKEAGYSIALNILNPKLHRYFYGLTLSDSGFISNINDTVFTILSAQSVFNDPLQSLVLEKKVNNQPPVQFFSKMLTGSEQHVYADTIGYVVNDNVNDTIQLVATLTANSGISTTRKIVFLAK